MNKLLLIQRLDFFKIGNDYFNNIKFYLKLKIRKITEIDIYLVIWLRG